MNDHPRPAVRVAITGGTGFVGGHLAMRLSGQGHEVVLVARGTDRRPLAREVLRLPRATLVPVGIDDQDGLARALLEAAAARPAVNQPALGAWPSSAWAIRPSGGAPRASRAPWKRSNEKPAPQAVLARSRRRSSSSLPQV
jgi:NAD(P)-dependent dehydrogenase (short-subunit alcohol dehydrogenase family)